MSHHWEECISGIIKHKEGRMSVSSFIGCRGSVVTHVLSFISSEIKGIGVHLLFLLTFSRHLSSPSSTLLFPPGLFGSDLLHAWRDRRIASQQTGKTTGVSLRVWEFRCLRALLCKDVEVKTREKKNGLRTSILASFKVEKCAEERRRRQFVWWRLWKGWSNWDKVRSKGRETKDDGTRCRKTRDTQRFSEKSSIRHRIRGRGEEVNTSYRCSQIIIVIIEKGNARCKITQITARRPIVLPPRLSKV